MLGHRPSGDPFPIISEGPPPRYSLVVRHQADPDYFEPPDDTAILNMAIPGGGSVLNIPGELVALGQWVGWRRVERDGKFTKVPVNPWTGKLGSSTDHTTWASFNMALAGAQAGKWDGIGFVFNTAGPFVGIDLDDVIDPATGEIDADALAVVERFKSFAELSPSGTGIHIFVRGELPPGGRKRGDRECYDGGRFFTVTGKRATEHPIEECQDELLRWHAETFPDPAKAASAPSAPRRELELTDQQLVAKIGASKQGEKFARLWSGDTTGYASGSEADLALCSILAWWTNADRAAVDRLFRASGLMRPKWDARRGEGTYGGNTVERAVSTTQGGYDPNHQGGAMALLSPAKPTLILDSKTGDRVFKWMSELQARPANDKWVWNGFLSRGGITLLSALWKSGKTTLLSHLVKAFGGSDTHFAGRAIVPSQVLYVTEEDAETWSERRDKLGIGDHVGMVCRPFRGRPNPSQWLVFIDDLVAAVDQYGFGVVVIDTLSKLWPVRDENDATAVEESLMPLWKIAERGAAVLLVHHTRKSGGGEFTNTRGSGGLPAFCETLVSFSREDASDRHNRRRVLEGGGRYTETPSKWTIELAADGSGYTVTDDGSGSPAITQGRESWRGYLTELLPAHPPGITREAVNKLIAERNGKVGAAPANLLAELTALKERGIVIRTGDGVRGRPYKYHLPPTNET